MSTDGDTSPGPSNLVGTFLASPHDAFAALARKYGDPLSLPIRANGGVVAVDQEIVARL